MIALWSGTISWQLVMEYLLHGLLSGREMGITSWRLFSGKVTIFVKHTVNPMMMLPQLKSDFLLQEELRLSYGLRHKVVEFVLM